MGRRKLYDTSEVLEKAVFSFWRNGYDRTSVRVLEKDMGINQFSIYASFKNKSTLYKLVLQRYSLIIESYFLERLQSADAQLYDIQAFIESFAFSIKDRIIPEVCLITQTNIRLHAFDSEVEDLVRVHYDKLKSLFTLAVINSQSSKLIPQEMNAEQIAKYLLGLHTSVNAMAKLATKRELRNQIKFAVEALTNLRYIN